MNSGVPGTTFDLSCACTLPSWFLCLDKTPEVPWDKGCSDGGTKVTTPCPSLFFLQHSDHLWAIVKTDRGAAKIARIVHTVTPQLLANQLENNCTSSMMSCIIQVSSYRFYIWLLLSQPTSFVESMKMKFQKGLDQGISYQHSAA